MMDTLRADLVYTARAIAARPGFAATVILTLGLGIGANAAIFSAVHALLLRPFPFKDPDQLVRISRVKGGEEGPLAVPEQDDLAALTGIIDDIALYTDQGLYNASGFGEPEELQATITTHNLFRVLGVAPLVGSSYPPDTDRLRQFELVISYGLWVRRFGSDPNIVGRTMTLDGDPGYTIHGVMPRGFNFPSHSDLFRSSGIAPDPKSFERRDIRQRMAVARLEPGVSVAHARERIEALGLRLQREFPETNAGMQFHVMPIRDLYVGDVRPYLVLLFGAVVLVLLIACSNVVNLLLSRALVRDRELAVRTALGAGRARLVRQLLTESVVLGLLGGVVGLALAAVGVPLLVRLVEIQLPGWMDIQLDRVTLGFLLAVSVLTGLAAGLIPALRTDRHLHDALKEGSRGSSQGVRHHRVRNALVVAKVAVALILLVGASLMVQSFMRLQRVDPGFDPASLLTFRVELGWRAYDTHEKIIQFNDRVLERLAALPGVVAVGLDSNLPLSGRPRDPLTIAAEGQTVDEQHVNPLVHQHVVSAGYFQALGIPIEQGRGFTDADHVEAPPAVVVSRRLANRLWPDRDPIGQRIRIDVADANAPWWTVVGVARDVTFQHLADRTSFDVYQPYRQIRMGSLYFVARTQGVPPSSLVHAAPRIVPETDPDQSFFDVRVMSDRIAAGIWQQRAAGALFALFAGLAVALAATGLYGVLSYVVSQQWREIGVRVALGAQAEDVWRLVLRRGLTPTLIGIGIGLVGALAGIRMLGTVLYEVSATDPWTFFGVPILLLLIAVGACALPAWRATRVDPVIALRAE